MSNKTFLLLLAGVFVVLAIWFMLGGMNGAVSSNEDQNVPSRLPTYLSVAHRLGLNVDAVRQCVEERTYLPRVRELATNAVQTGAQGTPWTIVVAPDGQRYAMNGALPYEDVLGFIERARNGEQVGASSESLEAMLPVTEDDHIRGSKNAEVMLVEYSDLDCPFCKRFHETMLRVMDRYASSSEVAWVYRHFPLVSLHPDALRKALAAECVADLSGNEAFWRYVDAMEKISSRE